MSYLEDNLTLVIFFPTFYGESYELRFAIRTFPVIVQSTIISQHMVPFSWELKSQQRSEKIWALHTVNIRTIRPENIFQMNGKMNTIYGKKSLQCMGIEHHSTVWTCALALLATEPATEVVPFFIPLVMHHMRKWKNSNWSTKIFRFMQCWIITPIYCKIWGKVQKFLDYFKA